ncbi:MAG: hypothetical protein HC837_18225, partial [Chloroflexaceae bacterium]|nr:hypothetical protein [Chloroflexaceae bacterium]
MSSDDSDSLPADTAGLPAQAHAMGATLPIVVNRPWWRSAWVSGLLLVVILAGGGYFRFLGLFSWDGNTGQHPDERFFVDVTSSVRLPASFSEYFDATRSPGNPRNVGKTFFVYGTFPVLLTRLTAVALTPPEAMPETVPDIAGRPGVSTEMMGQIANPERDVPRLGPLVDLLNPDGINLATYGELVKV